MNHNIRCDVSLLQVDGRSLRDKRVSIFRSVFLFCFGSDTEWTGRWMKWWTDFWCETNFSALIEADQISVPCSLMSPFQAWKVPQNELIRLWGEKTALALSTYTDAESLKLRLGASNAVAWWSYLHNLIEAIITFISQNSASVQLNHLCISESWTHVFLSNFLYHSLSFFYAVAKAMNVVKFATLTTLQTSTALSIWQQ